MDNGYSMKEIAAKLGVNKMKVYRAIKKLNIAEQYENHNTMYFSETDMSTIIKEIESSNSIQKNVTSNGQTETVKLIEMLKERLIKQDQIIEQQREQLKLEREEYQKELKELKLTNIQLTNAVLADNKELHNRLDPQPKNDVIDAEKTENILDSEQHSQQKKAKKRWLFG